MGCILFTTQNSVSEHNQTDFFLSVFVGGIVTIITLLLYVPSSSYVKAIFKRHIRIQIRKRFIDPCLKGSDANAFISYYQSTLCHLQKINNELLANILRDNHFCAFFVDRSISFLSSHRPHAASPTEVEYASIDEFRQKVPLTTYDDYRNYIDRIILHGENNELISDDIKGTPPSEKISHL
jgi:hypothetical protein